MAASLRRSTSKVLERYIKFTVKNPWKIVFGTVVFNILFGLGLLSRVPNNDFQDLYVPRGTVSETTRDELSAHFPDRSNDKFLTHATVLPPLFTEVIVVGKKDVNILSPNNTREIKRLVEYVKNVSLSTGYRSNIKYDDVCAKYYDKCVVNGQHTNLADIALLSEVEAINNTMTVAKRRKIRFYLRQETSGYRQDSIAWSDKFIQTIKYFGSNEIDILYSDSLSFFDRLNSDTYKPDIRIFGLVFTGFIVYCSLLVSGGDCLSKRTNLGRMGIIVTPLSILGAWGFLSSCNVQFTNITGVMALVALFIQVCCMMLMLSNVSINFDIKDHEQRILVAVRESIPPTVMTIFVLLVPFCFGIISKYKGIELMCIYTVVTVIFSFINHVTLFVACLALHEKRIDEGKHCCTCRPIQSRQEAENSQKSGCFICCCTGSIPSSPNDTEHVFLKFPKFLLSKLVLRPPFKIANVIIWMGLIGVSVWLNIELKARAFEETDVKSGSYFYEFNRANQYFSTSSSVTLFKKEVDNSLPSNILSILNDLTAYENNIKQKTGSRVSSIFWGQSFIKENCSSAVGQSQFSKCLQSFLSNNQQFQSDVAFDNSGLVSAFRLYLIVNSTRQTKTMVNLVEYLGSSVTLGGLRFEIYNPDFLFTDSYKFAFWELLRFCGIQLIVLMACIGCGLKDMIMCAHVGIWYVATCTVSFGFMNLFGVSSITPIGTAAYVLAISVSIPVIVFSHCAYSGSCGLNRNVRTHQMLVTTSSFLLSVLLALSICLLILLLVHSYVFVTVFKTMEACCCVCLLITSTGIPTCLSTLGSMKMNTQSRDVTREINLKEVDAFDNKGFKNVTN